MAASASLARPRIDKASLARLQPDSDPAARYKPKEVYDALMAVEVPTTSGGLATVKILPYRMAGNTPKDLTSRGDPDYKGLEDFIKRSRQVKWSKAHWVLSVDVDTARDPYGQCFLRPVETGVGSRFSSLFVPPAGRSVAGSQYFPAHEEFPSFTTTETIEIHNHEMMRFFTGKARPREVARALFLAQAVGAVAPTETALQAYCDDHSGMDCSGVAALIYGYVGLDRNASWYTNQGIARTRIEDIRARDAIVWLKANHIAIVDSVDPGADENKITCWVVESTAGKLVRSDAGVQYSQYVFERDDTQKTRKYKCFRPSVTGKPTELSGEQITVQGNV